MNNVVIFVLKAYQAGISPLIKQALGAEKQCRFEVTCSQYAVEAYKNYNLFKASYLSVKRVVSCNPFYT